MTVFQAFVLGIIQGLSEFLPISSSAHLALAPWLFGWKDPGLAFDVALHIGTLAAVLWYFRHEWAQLLRTALNIIARKPVDPDDRRMLFFLIIATIPGAIGGVLLNDMAETVFRSPWIMGCTLIVLGILLWFIDRVRAQARTLESMTWREALIIGIAQMCALVPGVSRSGSTMTAGRALAFNRESAARFSFLMSMPITAAAAIFKVPEAVKADGVTLPLAVGVLASAVSGWLAISVLLRYVRTRSYGVFAVYRIILGIIIFSILVSRGQDLFIR